MKLLGLLGVVAFTLASGVVGVRLLLLARRTRQAPELAMGLAFVVSAAVGFPLLTAASVIGLSEGSQSLARTLMTLGTFFTFSGYVGLGVGCWRIYRPGERWPLAAIAAGAATVVAASATVALAPELATRELAFWPGVCVGALTFAWNASESFLLHGQLRRRLALGLADPEVVNRVWMWGLGSAAACAMTLHALALRIAAGPLIGDGQRIVSSLLGMIAAVAIALAFFPPAAYRRRFAAGPQPSGSA